MRGRSRLANDAWEALLSAHARLMKRFAAEDIWGKDKSEPNTTVYADLYEAYLDTSH